MISLLFPHLKDYIKEICLPSLTAERRSVLEIQAIEVSFLRINSAPKWRHVCGWCLVSRTCLVDRSIKQKVWTKKHEILSAMDLCPDRALATLDAKLQEQRSEALYRTLTD